MTTVIDSYSFEQRSSGVVVDIVSIQDSVTTGSRSYTFTWAQVENVEYLAHEMGDERVKTFKLIVEQLGELYRVRAAREGVQ